MSHFFIEQAPESPDYEQLRKIVADLDKTLNEEGRPLSEVISPLVDLYSAQYLAERRADLVCAQLGLNPRMRPYLAATFLNAFTIGVIFERERTRAREWEKNRDRRS